MVPVAEKASFVERLNSLIGLEYEDQNYSRYQESLQGEITKVMERLESLKLPTQLIKQDRQHRLQFLRESNGRFLARSRQVLETVESVGGDIREIVAQTVNLDQMHRHLTKFITILERLRAFINNVDALERMLMEGVLDGAGSRGAGMASRLLATQQLGRLIEILPGSFIRVQMVRFTQLQRMIQRHILEIFETRMRKRRIGIPGTDTIILGHAALVMDVIGEEAHQALIRWYCQHQLADYQDVFRGNRELSNLESVPKRYAWLKRLLLAYEAEHINIFPSSWRVDFALCLEFCHVTGMDLAKMVNNLPTSTPRSGGELDLVLLQATIQQTLQFESFLQHKFGVDRQSGLVLSLAFEPAVSYFVDAHDVDLGRFIAGLPGKPSAGDFESGSNVLASAPELFLLFREMLQDISSLSSKKPLGDLASVFVKHLFAYSQYIDGCTLEGQQKSSSANNKTRKNPGLAIAEMKLLAVLVNTCDYCRLTVEQMEARLRKLIDPRCEDEIQFDDVKQNFLVRLASCMGQLHQLISANLQPVWKSLESIRWTSHTANNNEKNNVGTPVGDQDEFVTILQKLLTADLYSVRGMLMEANHYVSLCDRIVVVIFQNFRHQLNAIHPLTETIAQQLLIDLESIRSTLIDAVPRGLKYAGMRHAYERLVTKEALPSERLLKCLLLAPEPISFFVQNYIVVTTDSNESHFIAVLNLRGIRTTLHGLYLDEFRKVLPHRPSEAQDDEDLGSPGGKLTSTTVREFAKLNGQLRKILLSITNGNTSPIRRSNSSTTKINPDH